MLQSAGVPVVLLIVLTGDLSRFLLSLGYPSPNADKRFNQFYEHHLEWNHYRYKILHVKYANKSTECRLNIHIWVVWNVNNEIWTMNKILNHIDYLRDEPQKLLRSNSLVLRIQTFDSCRPTIQVWLLTGDSHMSGRTSAIAGSHNMSMLHFVLFCKCARYNSSCLVSEQ